jgi:peptidoglycan lytic transglycosylase
MSREPANKTMPGRATLLAAAIVAMLACVGAPGALASSGGSGAPVSAGATAVKGTHAKPRHGADIATWFGPGFYGQKTACGQTMTPLIVGVASRTLPCGTLVLVAYAGHTLTVPVIDRGPYAHNGAKWDLTWGAASALAITETVRVRTKVVGRTANTPLLGVPAPSPLMAMQAASGGTAAA